MMDWWEVKELREGRFSMGVLCLEVNFWYCFVCFVCVFSWVSVCLVEMNGAGRKEGRFKCSCFCIV